MPLKSFELISIILSALFAGMFVGPWLALSRTFSTLAPEIFIPIVKRMSRSMRAAMTVLMPLTLLSLITLLAMSYHGNARLFSCTLATLLLFVTALLVTVLIEVPIVKQIETWTIETLPADWQRLRDRWGKFHILRIAAAVAGLILLAVGVIFT